MREEKVPDLERTEPNMAGSEETRTLDGVSRPNVRMVGGGDTMMGVSGGTSGWALRDMAAERGRGGAVWGTRCLCQLARMMAVGDKEGS